MESSESDPTKVMTLWLLLTIILVEGFVTISVEILTIRQLMPVMGNSVVVTSLIIGIFLLFLALGYQRGGYYKHRYQSVLAYNFTRAALWLGVGLSYMFIKLFFSLFYLYISKIALIALVAYLLLITAPIVYVLGQTLPITTNLFKFEHHVGSISGKVLCLSTLGSFLGAVLSTLLLMNYFGVAWTVTINYLLLTLLVVAMVWQVKTEWLYVVILIVAGLFIYVLNIELEKTLFVKTNNYANYAVDKNYRHPKIGKGKLLSINGSPSSFIDKKKKSFAYIELIKKILFKDLKMRNKDILVLGAGGFTLSAENDYGNRFTYNDIDGHIVKVAKGHFLEKINGKFVKADARVLVQQAKQKYDVIVSDTYSSRSAIPYHLLTREYFQTIKQLLQSNGIAIFNIIARPTLTDPYSKNVDTTLRSVFQNCMVIPLDYSSKPTNIIYVCKKVDHPRKQKVYTDNLNSAAFDFWRARDLGAW